MAFDETDPGYDHTTDPDYNPNGGTGGQTSDGGPAGGLGDGGKPSGGEQTGGGSNSPNYIVAPSVLTSTAENVVLYFKNMEKYEGQSICNKGVIEMFKRIYKTVPKGMNVVANDMVAYWKKTPDHWIPISVHDAQDYANKT